MNKIIVLHKLVKDFKANITKGFGRKCKEYSWGCGVCEAHRTYEGFLSLMETMSIISKAVPKGLKKKKGRE